MDTTCSSGTMQINAKQGSTFHWAGTINLPTGSWTAYASVVQSGTRRLIGDLVVTLGSPTLGVYPIELFSDNEATALWNVPKLECDILFVDSALIPNIVPTQTFVILVDRQITVYPTP